MKPAVSLLFLFIFVLCISVSGQILNRSFELAAPEPNYPLYITPPLNWNYENNATLQAGVFNPNNPRTDWTIPGPCDGVYYLRLSTGGFGFKQDYMVVRSSVSQRLYLPAGTLIRGEYFFGTCDYRPYCDSGTIELKPAPCDPNNPDDPNNPCDPNAPNYYGNLTTIQLAHCSISDVNDYGSTEQWIPFSHTIMPQEKGVYDLILLVEDGIDAVYESYFAVDDLSICGAETPYGDLSQDCLVDLRDLSLFARHWLETCIPDPNLSDPEEAPDPNCLCIYADFSNDLTVDANDLDPFKENWLLNDL